MLAGKWRLGRAMVAIGVSGTALAGELMVWPHTDLRTVLANARRHEADAAELRCLARGERILLAGGPTHERDAPTRPG